MLGSRAVCEVGMEFGVHGSSILQDPVWGPSIRVQKLLQRWVSPYQVATLVYLVYQTSANHQTKSQPRSCKLQNLDKTEHKQSCVMAAALKAELHSTLHAPDVALKPEP